MNLDNNNTAVVVTDLLEHEKIETADGAVA
jgi:hypothetical protein